MLEYLGKSPLPDLSNFYCHPGRAGGSPKALGRVPSADFMILRLTTAHENARSALECGGSTPPWHMKCRPPPVDAAVARRGPTSYRRRAIKDETSKASRQGRSPRRSKAASSRRTPRCLRHSRFSEQRRAVAVATPPLRRFLCHISHCQLKRPDPSGSQPASLMHAKQESRFATVVVSYAQQ